MNQHDRLHSKAETSPSQREEAKKADSSAERINTTSRLAAWDFRQVAVFSLAVALLTTAVVLRLNFQASSTTFLSAALFRISLVLLAVAFAWESLKRPARWLPPGMAAICLVALGVLAAQPRLILVLGPLVGGLCVIGGLLRTWRKR